MRLVSAIKRYGFSLVLAISCFACHSEPVADQDPFSLPYRPAAYSIEEPGRFVRMNIPEENPLTQAGVALGKQLFFDPMLSVDSTISCASCHVPGLAFTDGLAFSNGVNGGRSTRNSPSLLNVAYQTNGLFWDGRVKQLEELVIHPVQDSNEMANDWEKLIDKIRTHSTYPALYRQAFGIENSTELDRRLTARALAQYLRTLISGNSRYDRYKAGEISLTAAEDRGRRIFFDIDDGLPVSECGHCHVEPLFSGMEYFNNGLDQVSGPDDFSDGGRGGVTGRPGERGAFRTPSLRNVTLTAPYMHDGRFRTLEEVIDHYNSGGAYGENVHPNVRPLHLSERDKTDLIAFLHSLTETTYTKVTEQ